MNQTVAVAMMINTTLVLHHAFFAVFQLVPVPHGMYDREGYDARIKNDNLEV
jgi:hypothetical protein